MTTKRRVTSQLVLETAIALADKEGFESVTLASVAQQLGIRNPSLYNHISSLADLQSQMMLWAVRHVVDLLRRVAVGKSGDEAVISVGLAMRDFARQHPGLYVTVQKSTGPMPPDLVAAREDLLNIFLAILSAYDLPQEGQLHAVRALRSILHGFIDLEVLGGFGMDLDRDESFRRLLDVFIAGLPLYRSYEESGHG
jgi:AcrR family transcriptional regulator